MIALGYSFHCSNSGASRVRSKCDALLKVKKPGDTLRVETKTQSQCRLCAQSNLLPLRASVFPPPSGPLGAPGDRGPPSRNPSKWTLCCGPRPGVAGRPSCGPSELWDLRRAAEIQSTVQFGSYWNRRAETARECVDVKHGGEAHPQKHTIIYQWRKLSIH